MVYKIQFETDVAGIASTKRIEGTIYVYSRDASQARNFAEGYITGAYSETFAIFSVEPIMVLELPAV